MNEKRNGSQIPAATAMTLDDVYFVLFRHKWAIIICSLIGVAAAATVLYSQPALYSSEAKLYVKYVTDETTPNPVDPNDRVKPGNGDSIIKSEVEILKSMDLAEQVAVKMGPERILAKYGGGKDPYRAAQLIHDNFTTDVFPGTVVLLLAYTHRDPALAKEVLGDIIAAYMEKHKQVHNPHGPEVDEMVETERTTYVEQLDQAIKALVQARKEAGVSDVDGDRKETLDKKAKMEEQLAAAKMALTEQKKKVEALRLRLALVAKTATNATESAAAKSDAETVRKYQAVCEKVNSFWRQEQDLLGTYTDENPLVKEKRDLRMRAEALQKKMEQEYPGLTQVVAGGKTDSLDKESNLETETAKQQTCEDAIKYYQTAIEELNGKLAKIDEYEVRVGPLKLKKEVAENNLRIFSKKAADNKIEGDFAVGKTLNIMGVQDPSNGSLEVAKTGKIVGIVLASGILLGLAYAFLVELYLDRTVKRAKEVESGMGLRLFLSIPDLGRNGHRASPKPQPKGLLPAGAGKNGDAEAPTFTPAVNGTAGVNGNCQIAPWDPGHALHQYSEALRDRLISYFERNNIVHKPKLVAVSGSSKGCGATTIAAGLAASLSETGAGKVLFVDMNLEQGATQQFHGGKPDFGLDTALEAEAKHSTMVQENLYRVAGRANGDKLSAMLPARFASLVPKLRASDYDFIIFDMPPIGRTGVTQRLAGFMDMILLVVEAEKTNRDVVRQASHLLTESKANVSVVLNKTRSYIPARLHQEF